MRYFYNSISYFALDAFFVDFLFLAPAVLLILLLRAILRFYADPPARWRKHNRTICVIGLVEVGSVLLCHYLWQQNLYPFKFHEYSRVAVVALAMMYNLFYLAPVTLIAVMAHSAWQSYHWTPRKLPELFYPVCFIVSFSLLMFWFTLLSMAAIIGSAAFGGVIN